MRVPLHVVNLCRRFELADNWSHKVDASAYVLFLTTLLERIAERQPSGELVWRADDNIDCGDYGEAYVDEESSSHAPQPSSHHFVLQDGGQVQSNDHTPGPAKVEESSSQPATNNVFDGFRANAGAGTASNNQASPLREKVRDKAASTSVSVFVDPALTAPSPTSAARAAGKAASVATAKREAKARAEEGARLTAAADAQRALALRESQAARAAEVARSSVLGSRRTSMDDAVSEASSDARSSLRTSGLRDDKPRWGAVGVAKANDTPVGFDLEWDQRWAHLGEKRGSTSLSMRRCRIERMACSCL